MELGPTRVSIRTRAVSMKVEDCQYIREYTKVTGHDLVEMEKSLISGDE